MLDDLRRRLDDLTTTAVDLGELLARDGADQLPGLLIARAAVAIDAAAAELARHLELLLQSRPAAAGKGV